MGDESRPSQALSRPRLDPPHPSRGAESRGSPALASARIRKWEDTPGVRLVHRTTRRVSLTEDVKAFSGHALEASAQGGADASR
ncbi:LysR family transcriptional regulator [Halomonas sp. THAF12]|uniref:helix-turn-helix domain-containing protein n=1 Tax=Halomonas sp. THAF12 TaxID=2587849 RepID=UPI003462FA7C